MKRSAVGRRLSRITLLSAVIVLAGAEASAAAELTPRERFEREAPAAWAELRWLAGCIKGEGSTTTKDHLTGKVEENPTYNWRNNGICECVPLRRNRLECENEDYEFVIEEPGDGKWRVEQLLWKDKKEKQIAAGQIYWDEKDGTVGASPWQQALGYACRGLLIQATWLPRIVASPTFRVTEATTVRDEQDGRELVQIKFVNPVPRSHHVTFERGEITLDPARYWQVVRATVNGRQIRRRDVVDGPKEYDIVFTIENEYDVADGKLPYASRQSLRTQMRTLVDRENVYLTKLALGDRNDFTPFRLPAFGLPEPVIGQDPEN